MESFCGALKTTLIVRDYTVLNKHTFFRRPYPLFTLHTLYVFALRFVALVFFHASHSTPNGLDRLNGFDESVADSVHDITVSVDQLHRVAVWFDFVGIKRFAGIEVDFHHWFAPIYTICSHPLNTLHRLHSTTASLSLRQANHY